MAADPRKLSDYAYWRARGHNKTEAYLKVSPDVDRSSACVIAIRWEADPSFPDLIAGHRSDYIEEITAKEETSKDRIMKELETISFSSLEGIDALVDALSGGEVSLEKLSESAKKTISSVSLSVSETDKGRSSRISFGLHSKTPALQLMMKRYGMVDSLSTHIAGLREYGLIVARDDAGNWTIQQDEFSGALTGSSQPALPDADAGADASEGEPSSSAPPPSEAIPATETE